MYGDLAAPATASLEALKRAIFLDSYEQAEPGCFTGIGGLDPAANHRALKLLDSALAGIRDFSACTDFGFQPSSARTSSGVTIQ